MLRNEIKNLLYTSIYNTFYINVIIYEKKIFSLLLGAAVSASNAATPQENVDANFPDKGKTPYLSAAE